MKEKPRYLKRRIPIFLPVPQIHHPVNKPGCPSLEVGH
jgi:hypothetical protein